MKISIKDFGPIKEFNYDLSKGFIVTYGDNNIGKSYAMQLVYLLIKNLIRLRDRSFHPRYTWVTGGYVPTLVRNKAECIVSKFKRSGDDSIDITDMINTCIAEEIQEVFFGSFENSCKNTFGNYEGIAAQTPKLSLELGEFLLNIDLRNSKVDGSFLENTFHLKRTSKGYYKSRNTGKKQYIYYSGSDDESVKLIADHIEQGYMRFLAKVIEKCGDVYFLPASRSGIYSGMNGLSAIIAELSKSRGLLTKKIELPGISEPISDYYLRLVEIKSRENSHLKDIYTMIESEILSGRVEFNKARNTIVYVPENASGRFEMTEVSSMVSEISPIVAFLKYIIGSQTNSLRGLPRASRRAIVFIEEPEAHLHPKNQVALIEAFAGLCKHGIKLVISSHSNYVFNKLNNLILSKEMSHEAYSPIFLQQNNSGSVSKFMKIDELGVCDENFVDIAEQLMNERDDIIQSWNGSDDDA